MIGTGTYAFSWRLADADDVTALVPVFAESAALGAAVFQICDFLPLEFASDDELSALREAAAASGLILEIGTRGVDEATLTRFLHIAAVLGASTVRSMGSKSGESVDLSILRGQLTRAAPRFEHAGVTLVLETYEQVRSVDLVATLDEISSDALGVCLDPANSLAALETPSQVIETTLPWVKNVHAKDFGFDRRPGGFGFEVTGRALGTGQLDLLGMLDKVYLERSDTVVILEHWLPWQGDRERTIARETDWLRIGMTTLRDDDMQRAGMGAERAVGS